MRRLSIILIPSVFSCCISLQVFSQNTVRYGYDNTGNRINREIVLTKKASVQQAQKQVAYTENIQTHKIVISPNPTKGLINVEFSNINKCIGQISVYELSGKLIVQSDVLPKGNAIDISMQPDGVYLMQISMKKEVSTWIIIKN